MLDYGQIGLSWQTLLLWAGLVGLAVFCLIGGYRFQLWIIRLLWQKVGRLGVVGLAVASLLLGKLAVHGSLKNTNGVMSRARVALRVTGLPGANTNALELTNDSGPLITDDEIVRGWRVDATNDGNRIAGPFAGITTNRAWWLRGSMDDAERYESPNGIGYPYGDLVTSGFTVLARGEVQPTVHTNFFPRPFAENLSLAPGVKGGLLAEGPSVFWSGWTASNSFVATWQHALYARNPNTQTNFQAEIFADGSFVYRYPEQEIRFERVSSFDFDGDGLANAIDPQPCEAGEDGHGQNEVWVRASFTNATEILQVGYTNWVAQTVGTNCPNGLFAFSVTIPETPGHDVHLQVGSFHVVFREPACFSFLLPVDERLDMSLSDDCPGIEYTWDDGYRGNATSCLVDFVPPMRNQPGGLRMIPLLIVNPTELDVSTAKEGALLSTFINRADVLNEWDEEFGEASFSDGENQGLDGRFTTPSNSVTVAQVSGETRLTVTAVSGTNSVSATVDVAYGPGESGGTAPPEEEPTRDDASLSLPSAEISSPDPVDPEPVRWIGFVGEGEAGQVASTNGTFTLAAHRSYYVGVFMTSREFPFWTGRILSGEGTRYDDYFSYHVMAGNNVELYGRGQASQFHGELARGLSANGCSPLAFVNGAFFTNTSDEIRDASVRFAMRNEDDSRRPTGLMIGIFPLSIIQSNFPVTTNGVPSSTDWGVRTNRLIKVGDVAYITGTPEPPAWTACLRGLPSWQTNGWSGALRTERARRGVLDDRSYALTNLVGDAQLDLRAFMQNEIVGGCLTLTTQVMTAKLNTPIPIRGKNPLDATARAFIDSHVDAEFREYAWMIARHESRRGQRVYNQFNPSGRLVELPDWGSPFGWGMCQIDRGATGDTTVVVYNWKTNVVEMNVKLCEARDTYNRLVRRFRLMYQNDPNVNWTEPDNCTTNCHGVEVSAKGWSVMSYYNGAGGCPAQTYNGVTFLTPIEFVPQNSTWIFHLNSQSYVPSVVNEQNLDGVE